MKRRPSGSVPDGYEQVEIAGAHVVAQQSHVDAIRRALHAGSLYEYAAHHPEARPLTGRGVAYAAPLPDGTPVVVRHNRHGGLLAPVTGDRFFYPTRAPLELDVSRRLRANGVPTPPIVAYVVYRAGLLLHRSDVASAEVSDSADLAAVWMRADDREREQALAATAALLCQLARCGARHHDLNVKNVLLASSPSAGLTAWVLDVDRVEFGRPGDAALMEGNLERFIRSARKWRALYGARIDDAELERLASAVRSSSLGDPSMRDASTRS